MAQAKIKTYVDKLLKNKKFKAKVEKEYAHLSISEEITRIRHEANLTQAALARKIKSSKTAISRYESGKYHSYSIPLLQKIAKACDAQLVVHFQ